VNWDFEAEVFQWRGPAPYFFVTAPAEAHDFLQAHHSELTYGWRVIPAVIRIGSTEVTTSLIPKDGRYLVPLKVALRRAEHIDDGDRVRVRLQVGTQREAPVLTAVEARTFVIDAAVAIDLATAPASIPSEHQLIAPTLLRLQVQALLYSSARRGDIDDRTARKILVGIRDLGIRFLGDRSLEDNAWRLAVELNWPDVHQMHYVALTQLQADALVTADPTLATTAGELVTIATTADLHNAR